MYVLCTSIAIAAICCSQLINAVKSNSTSGDNILHPQGFQQITIHGDKFMRRGLRVYNTTGAEVGTLAVIGGVRMFVPLKPVVHGAGGHKVLRGGHKVLRGGHKVLR
eukprot:Lankesteria_metandrocarpae@DN719_c0_g1_i1.p1